MPWSMNNPPNVAKYWNPSQQAKCINAANHVLAEGGTDEEAIFACIHAAGKTREKQAGEDAYDNEILIAIGVFQELLLALLKKAITTVQYRERMRTEIRDHHIRMFLLGVNDEREITPKDLRWLEDKITEEYEYLEGFIEDLEDEEYSMDRALWRSSLYAMARSSYIAGTVPPDVFDFMPVLPGEDCLGGDLCRCTLDVSITGSQMTVEWILDPQSESCAVCIGHALNSPYVFDLGEL